MLVCSDSVPSRYHRADSTGPRRCNVLRRGSAIDVGGAATNIAGFTIGLKIEELRQPVVTTAITGASLLQSCHCRIIPGSRVRIAYVMHKGRLAQNTTELGPHSACRYTVRGLELNRLNVVLPDRGII